MAIGLDWAKVQADLRAGAYGPWPHVWDWLCTREAERHPGHGNSGSDVNHMAYQAVQGGDLTAAKHRRGTWVRCTGIDMEGLWGRSPHPGADVKDRIGIVLDANCEIIGDDEFPQLWMYTVLFGVDAEYAMADYELEEGAGCPVWKSATTS